LTDLSLLLTENGHKIALDKLQKKAILNLDLRLGEGTGAVLAMSLFEAGVKTLTQMTTFSEAGVSTPRSKK
jgi:nicotinate-nucleotide--dimethylbenzimidazole phosphoribosyltransferase